MLTAARSYREACGRSPGSRTTQVWYARLDADQLLAELRATMPAKLLRRLEAMLAKARTRDSLQAFNKLGRGR